MYTFSDSTFTFTIISPTTVSVKPYNIYTISGSITIPSTATHNGITYSVTTIPVDSFRSNNITSVTIPNTINNIEQYSFYQCINLTTFNFPSSIISTNGIIGNYVFNNCSKLTSINISEGFTTMGVGVFKNCTSLISITLPSTLSSISVDMLSNCNKLPSLSIPYGVTSIGGGAIQNCNKLNSVTIPNSVTSIGNYAFTNCVLLPSVIIPNSVTSIGNYSFYNCGLTSVTLSSMLISIGDYVFWNCGGLTSLTIPPLVTSIGSNALLSVSNNLTFQGTPNTINIMNVPSGTLSSIVKFIFTNPSVSSASITGSQLKTNYSTQVSNATYVPASPTGFSFNSSTNVLSWNASTGATSYTISYGITDGSNYNLGPITISSTSYTLTGLQVGTYYFVIKSNNSAGSSVNSNQISVTINPAIPTGLSFNSTTNVLSWTAVPDANYNVFYGSTSDNVNTAFLSNTSNAYTTLNVVGANFYAVQSIQNNATSAKSTSLSVTINPAIPTGLSFNSTTNVLSWTAVPDANYNVFYGSTLDNVNTSFISNTSNAYATLNIFGEKYYAVQSTQNGVTSAKSTLLSVNIYYISNNLIYKLTDTNSVSVAAYNKSIISGSIIIPSTIINNETTYNVTSIEANGFSGCSELTSITIPNSIVNIYDSAFSGCSILNTIKGPFGQITLQFMFSLSLFTLDSTPGSLTIANNIFQYCELLSTLIYSDGVTTIEGNTIFSLIPTITTVVIPGSVTNIGPDVFNDINIIFNGTPAEINNITVTSTTFSGENHFIFAQVLDINAISSTSSLSTNFESLVLSADLGCFLKGSKVLTDKNYVKIQKLKKGDLVQTKNNGLVPIKFIGKYTFYNINTNIRINSHLYKLNKKDFPELMEDLYITGGHPILVNKKKIDDETKNKLLDMAETGAPIITEGKYRVFSFINPKAELWNDEGVKDIYDIVLENEDPHRNYGIYVNGILTESMDEHFFLNYSRMKEINK
jgi:hypothetical protein